MLTHLGYTFLLVQASKPALSASLAQERMDKNYKFLKMARIEALKMCNEIDDFNIISIEQKYNELFEMLNASPTGIEILPFNVICDV